MDINRMWKQATEAPVIGGIAGKQVFSIAFSRFAPYFKTIGATVTVLEPNHVELVIPNKKKVHNHIGTVHAIALCNGLEMAMGALAEATIPSSKRWIPKGMTVEYTAKASSDITVVAETDQEQWDTADGDLHVRVKGMRTDGTVVIDGVIKLWVTDKPAKKK